MIHYSYRFAHDDLRFFCDVGDLDVGETGAIHIKG